MTYRLIGIPEFSEKSGVPRHKLRRMIHSGQIQGFLVGGRYWLTEQDIEFAAKRSAYRVSFQSVYVWQAGEGAVRSGSG